MTSAQLTKLLKDMGDPAIADHSRRFFKTGKGEYGEGDRFLGIRVPPLRKLAREYQDTPRREVQRLLQSPFHEARLCALLLLVRQFERGGEADKADIYTLYLDNTAHINNWDLVDSSAHQIVGAYLEDRDRSPLYRLVESDSLWERRIAIIATYHFIKRDDLDDTIRLSRQLLDDEEDLIHKAVGWMLRELGKRDGALERAFLQKHYGELPRTMLRYAIEKFPERERQQYLRGSY